MKILPIDKQILIKPITNKGILGDVSCRYGTVVAVGDGVTKIKVGNTIGYEAYGLKELMVDKEELVFISEDSDFLLCIIEL